MKIELVELVIKYFELLDIALKAMNIPVPILSDSYYLDKGFNSSMCCGVWLDWEPDYG